MPERERREGFSEFAMQLGLLSSRVEEMQNLLSGNGQPGFIREAQEHLKKIDEWIVVQIALQESKEKKLSRLLATWGILIAIASIGANVAIAWVK